MNIISTILKETFLYLRCPIRCLKDKPQKTDKVDHVAQSSINKPPLNRLKVEISSGKITSGQGEYIVFHQLPSGAKTELSPEAYEKVYKILTQNTLADLTKNTSEKGTKECIDRYTLIKSKIKEIDQNLEAVFIPRTLYELVFIRKCIEEDLHHKKICDDVDPGNRNVPLGFFKNNQTAYDSYVKEQNERRIKRDCWHLCYFTDKGDNEHAGVKQIAYRLNNVMIKAFNPTNQGFTHRELSEFVEKEIEFLKSHYKTNVEKRKNHEKGDKEKAIYNHSFPGPTTHFGYEGEYGSVKPMGIRHEADAQIIRDVLALECSKIAQHSLFVFRGADFQKDSTVCWEDKDTPYSISYGASLFSGCVYDGGATAFYYMRNSRNAYAIPVRFDQLRSSPFFVPTTHTIAQLNGHGEIFHARTKVWKGSDLEKIGGMNVSKNGKKRDHLESDLTKDELISQFEKYKKAAIQLKDS